MTQRTAVGTCISVSAALPATHDADGFAALTFTQVGELETIGELVTRHAAGSFTGLCSGKTSTLKGVEEAVTLEITAALDRDDAGQTIMTAARKSFDRFAFKVTEKNGDVTFFTGFVMSAGAQYNGPNDAIMAPFSIGINAPAVGETYVIVTA